MKINFKKSLFVDTVYSECFRKKTHILDTAVWLLKTHYRTIPGSCQTWRGTLRGLSQMITANIWRTGRRRTLSDGWWTTRGVGQCFLFMIKKCLCLNLSESSGKKIQYSYMVISESDCSFSTAEKRLADRTFTSDVSSYLTDQAIKDFVARLKAGQARRE